MSLPHQARHILSVNERLTALLQSAILVLQCVVFACQVEPVVPEQGVVSLVKLLQEMAKDFHGDSQSKAT